MTAAARRFGFNLAYLRGDIFGGVTAGVVALPLALAFGEASGAGPIAGLYGAIFVGFFASLFGGTGAQISGPTGPMIVVFAGTFASFQGRPDLIFATVILAGLLQIGLGLGKLGSYIRLVPYPVVSGFMSGIGCIIIALQVSRLFGHEPEGRGTIPALQSIPGSVADPVWPALAVGLLALAIVFFWPKAWSRWLPAPLAALIIGTLASLFLPAMPILEDIPSGFPQLIIPGLPDDQRTFVILAKAALILAFLGSIDSLLTSLVADNMTRTRHNSNQELIGQGIGNTIAGLFGGIPGAGATMRTVVNIRTGGYTKLSGMIHAGFLFAIVISLAPLAERIPHAVLAGILVKVGYDIIDWTYLRRAHKGPRWDLILMVVVLGLTVFVDLITAVGVGVALAALAFVRQIAEAQIKSIRFDPGIPDDPEERALMEKMDGKLLLFSFTGPLSFGAAADLGHHVRQRSEEQAALLLDFSDVPMLDVSAAMAVETVLCDARQAGKKTFICGMSDAVRQVLAALKADRCLQAGHAYPTRREALEAAEQALKSM